MHDTARSGRDRGDAGGRGGDAGPGPLLISRKSFLGRIGLLLGACLACCTPMKLILNAWPAWSGGSA